MYKKVLLAILIVLGFAAVISHEQKPVSVIDVNLDNLKEEFENNEVDAHEKYKEARVAVEGKVATVETSITGAPMLVLENGNYGINAEFNGANQSALSHIKRGDYVFLICSVQSNISSNISLTNCIFNKK